jgi:hypothetical protein
MPRHETPGSLANEAAICGRVLVWLDGYAKSCVDNERADFWIWRDGRRVALLECKRRFAVYDQWPDVMISADKYIACVESAAKADVPFIIAFGFNDGTYVHTHRDACALTMEYGGRTLNTRPHTATDREVVVKIPMRILHHIGDPP